MGLSEQSNAMIEIPVLDMQGKEIGRERLDPALLGGTVRAKLLKQMVVAYRANLRQGTVRQQSRSEVEGSTRKLYRQKGTGRARMGNLRTPVRRGGGRAFPRRPNDFSQDLPRRMRRLARNSAVLAKAKAGNLVILDRIDFPEPKTRHFHAVLKAINATRGCLLVLPAEDRLVWRSGRNIPDLDIKPVGQINAYDVLRRRRVVFVRDAYRDFVTKLSPANAAS
jgi:large subunit ribosomal protein L4